METLEDLVDAAVLGPIARLQVVRPGAGHLEDRAVEGPHGHDQADLLGWAGEAIATGVAARGGHQAGALQRPDQLLDVRVRQLVGARDARQRGGPIPVRVGQRHQDTDSVLGARRELHDSSTTISSPSRWTG